MNTSHLDTVHSLNLITIFTKFLQTRSKSPSVFDLKCNCFSFMVKSRNLNTGVMSNHYCANFPARKPLQQSFLLISLTTKHSNLSHFSIYWLMLSIICLVYTTSVSICHTQVISEWMSKPQMYTHT